VTAPRTTPVARIAFDDAVEQVRQGGGRITRARLELLKDLYAHGGRVTAEELAERHVDIEPATVYRSLSHFEEVGVVEHVHLGHGPAAYRWVGQRTVTAVCEECGTVTDIPASELDDLAERLEQRYGVRLSIGHFALSARCTDCVASGVRPQA
jgi:Fur family transcriptional regulator, ferric uptake regulator